VTDGHSDFIKIWKCAKIIKNKKERLILNVEKTFAFKLAATAKFMYV
jgi:hypothetical protein